MPGYRLLNIPVYAESPGQFVRKRKRAIGDRLAEVEHTWRQLGSAGVPASTRLGIEDAIEQSWGAWEYSRVVGWFRVTLDRGELVIHVYSHASRRFSHRARLNYRRTEYRADSLDLLHQWARDAAEWLLECLAQLQATWFPKRWMDWDSLRFLARGIRWTYLMRRTVSDLGKGPL